ncbi:MAG: alanine--tRNA ligase [Clostridiales bacterium]|nr:alanine--tRNA ligase [Clostridiales bacterium]
MEWTGLNDLREKYLSFFESKGHLRLPSFSLVPQGDKSLLLINSGMAPMKKYFTGEVTPPRGRVTTCQKCVRTPDIENVGKTARHGTFFEMLGNFSFGDYFKREAITWAWEFFTQIVGMPAERIYVTVYEEDDEAYNIWTKEVGLDPSHVKRMGKADNFWEHGSGPCGPCSELHFDRGEAYGCGSPDCGVGCECDRFVEIWNLVFTQFENDGKGHYTHLEHPNIDTGMGLERLACVVQNVDNIFEIDTMQRIMGHIMRLADVKYGEDEKKDVSLRVITDHIRSTTFLIGDGVMPSNEGRGYVLRRLLRRAARHGRLLGVKGPFLADVCDTVIEVNEGAYPVLAEKRDFIKKVIRKEEESFGKTIDTGLTLLDRMIDGCEGKTMSGEDAFKLSDTYGFPLDLTREILAERGMDVDEKRFNELIAEQRKRARDARRDAGMDAWKAAGNAHDDIPATQFMGYETLTQEATLLAAIRDGEPAEYVAAGEQAVLVLDRTPFYAESGGQVGDAGVISNGDFTFRVTHTTKTPGGVFLHHGTLEAGALASLGSVTAQVDEKTRRATMRNHTAAHLLQAALRKTLGAHVEQAGSMVNSKEVRFDFSHFEAMTPQEIRQVEDLVNEAILAALPVTTEEMPLAEAKKQGAMALFGEKYGDTVRVVRAGDFSTELCGGTHVDNTAKLGLFKIITESSVAAGVRRIQGVTGAGVLECLYQDERLLHGAAQAMKANNVSQVAERAQQLSAELKDAQRAIARLNDRIAASQAKELLAQARSVGALQLITARFDDMAPDALRALCETAKGSADNVVCVLAAVQTAKGTVNFAASCAKGAVAAGAHAGNLVRAVAKAAGGSGGGKPDTAMAGGKDAAKTNEALEAAFGALSDLIKSDGR